jgi:hypothetical protein
MRSRRMGEAGYVSCMGEDDCVDGFEGEARRKETTRKT